MVVRIQTKKMRTLSELKTLVLFIFPSELLIISDER